MSDKPITSDQVALAKREAEAAGEVLPIGRYPAAIQAKLDERKMLARVAAEIAGLSWGRELNQVARVAMARWAGEHGIDVTTEVDVLGGRPYLNARFYLNRAAEMQRAGVIAYMKADHVGVDGRLDQLAASEDAEISKGARREIARRMLARIEHGAPDKAAAVVVARIGVHHGPQVIEYTGCKWAGNGVRQRDPVGDAFPVETAESRAFRRALRLLVSHVPSVRRWIDAATDDGEIVVEAIHASEAQRLATETIDDARLLKHGVHMVDPDPMREEPAA